MLSNSLKIFRMGSRVCVPMAQSIFITRRAAGDCSKRHESMLKQEQQLARTVNSLETVGELIFLGNADGNITSHGQSGCHFYCFDDASGYRTGGMRAMQQSGGDDGRSSPATR